MSAYWDIHKIAQIYYYLFVKSCERVASPGREELLNLGQPEVEVLILEQVQDLWVEYLNNKLVNDKIVVASQQQSSEVVADQAQVQDEAWV